MAIINTTLTYPRIRHRHIPLPDSLTRPHAIRVLYLPLPLAPTPVRSYPQHDSRYRAAPATAMALDTFFHNKIEAMKLEIIQGQAKLRRLEAQRNDYNSRVRLLREELGLLQQPGSYVGEVVKVMGTKKVLVKVHPEGKYGRPAFQFGAYSMANVRSGRHLRQRRHQQTHPRQARHSPQ
jgi:hypothetical protein